MIHKVCRARIFSSTGQEFNNFHMIGLKHDWMLKSKSLHHLLPQSTLGCPSVFASCLSTSSLPVLQEFSLSGEKKSCYLQRCEEVVFFKILEQSVLGSVVLPLKC